MIKRILVPLDGSRLGERALAKAALLLQGREGASVIALRVLELPESSPLFESVDLRSARADELREVNEYLSTLREEVELSGVHLETRVIRSKLGVPHAIVAQAETENVDLIALTTHGRGGLARFFFGSVAEKVIRLAPMSVILVK